MTKMAVFKVQAKHGIHGKLDFLLFSGGELTVLVCTAHTHQAVQKFTVGRRIGQLERVQPGRFACFKCEVGTTDGADKDFHAPIQVHHKQIRVEAFGKRHHRGLQRGLTCTGRTQNQSMAGDFVADVVLFRVGKVEIEVVNRLGRGLQRHDCRTVANRIAQFLTMRIVVDTEGSRKVGGGFGERTRFFRAARHLAEKRRRCGQTGFGKTVAAGIQECGIGTRTVGRRFFRRFSVNHQSRMIIAEHQFARCQQTLAFLQFFNLAGGFIIYRIQIVQLLADFTLHFIRIDEDQALREGKFTRQTQNRCEDFRFADTEVLQIKHLREFARTVLGADFAQIRTEVQITAGNGLIRVHRRQWNFLMRAVNQAAEEAIHLRKRHTVFVLIRSQQIRIVWL